MDEDKVQWSYQSTLSMEELNATQNNRADLERFMQILQSQVSCCVPFFWTVLALNSSSKIINQRSSHLNGP
jgi:hypothetical protein